MPSWVIAGASRGIGLAFVQELAAHSSNVVFAMVRNRATATHLMPLVGGNVHVVEADITDVKALKAAAAEVAQVTGGPLDVLINNGAKTTGKFYFTKLTEFDGIEDEVEEEFMDAYRVNVVGVMHTINAFLPLLRAGPTKKIVTVSSAAGSADFQLRTGGATMVAYAATKAGVNMLMVKYANQLKSEGFVCVAVSPGIVNTEETTVGARVLPPGFQQALDNIARAFPEWTPIALTPKESAAKQLKMIAGLTAKDNGTFVSETGSEDLFKD